MALVTIKMTQNYTPRKFGEVVTLDERVAEYYFNIGVAVPHDSTKEECKEGCQDCEDCNKASVIQADSKKKKVTK